MTAAAVAPYTLRQIEEMLGLGRGAVAGLVAAGYVQPTRGPRNEHRFTFRDVVLLRTAHELRAARIPPRRLLQSLRRLRARLPAELPLSGLRIRAVGSEVVVREGAAQWEAQSGQLLLDLEVAQAASGAVAFLSGAKAFAVAGTAVVAGPAAAAADDSATAWFDRGQALEGSDPGAAQQAYRRAIEIDPAHEPAYVNLGALLCETGHCSEALALYEAALTHCPASAQVHFNRAIALEDGGDAESAVASYERCLEFDPLCADAHYNAARLHERLGHAQRAVRHYSAYRRLAGVPG